ETTGSTWKAKEMTGSSSAIPLVDSGVFQQVLGLSGRFYGFPAGSGDPGSSSRFWQVLGFGLLSDDRDAGGHVMTSCEGVRVSCTCTSTGM
ncbi:hypothetical protein BDZ91DRAFT_724442, partial [Kalaharituber pfeilii]